jgi:glycine cleavage system H protein
MHAATTHPEYPFPTDRHYDRETHLWALPEPDGPCVLVGIDVLGLAALGDLAYVSLCEPGTAVRRGEALGTLEAAKMTGEILAPLGGVVRRCNGAAARDPSLVNADPYGCWLVAIEPADWSREAAELVSGPALAEWVAGELARYRAEGWIA